MRTSEERVAELHRLMDQRKKEKSLRKYRLQSTAACAACLAITVVMALVIAQTPFQNPDAGSHGVSASIFANHALLGYVVVGLLAFFLGALVAIFCSRMRKHMEDEDHD